MWIFHTDIYEMIHCSLPPFRCMAAVLTLSKEFRGMLRGLFAAADAVGELEPAERIESQELLDQQQVDE